MARDPIIDEAHPAALDPTQFKLAMRQLAAAVTVVSTLKDGRPVGLLATAVCSVSVSPPTLLACINRSARSYGAIEASGFFCVNVLERQQQQQARDFASLDSAERFKLFDWSPLTTGAPAITGAIVAFDCTVVQSIPAETHMILIGRVNAVRGSEHGRPLLYFDGGYHGLA